MLFRSALVGADMYNSMRVVIFITGANYQAATPSSLATVLQHTTTNNVSKPLCDLTYALQSIAFDSNDLNSPSQEWKTFSCPINTIVDCISSSTRTVWDTKGGDLVINYVSDSALSPHPALELTARIHFRVMSVG